MKNFVIVFKKDTLHGQSFARKRRQLALFGGTLRRTRR